MHIFTCKSERKFTCIYIQMLVSMYDVQGLVFNKNRLDELHSANMLETKVYDDEQVQNVEINKIA